MIDDRRDNTFLIGLHKLAQQNGEGLVPELYDLLTRRPDEWPEGDKIMRFPIGRTRLPNAQMPDDLDGAPAQIIPLRRA
ncbi:hypothetical protein [Rhizobium sp. SSA_523]|uniref:hypothetical protein n=1 Tax=Rhizobium sp. SSA_523 TaxID=2952477 RepID=UPI0020912146|nr:hypothetical protein [Rhizobium sp. SSA_523]MCO5732124.1 hypothetical protein [Rhizobium sp. SSA_523]WKC25630.1 hypothetical protein QTJ18_16895 [Rhizobium sp. SSA_523]